MRFAQSFLERVYLLIHFIMFFETFTLAACDLSLAPLLFQTPFLAYGAALVFWNKVDFSPLPAPPQVHHEVVL